MKRRKITIESSAFSLNARFNVGGDCYEEDIYIEYPDRMDNWDDDEICEAIDNTPDDDPTGPRYMTEREYYLVDAVEKLRGKLVDTETKLGLVMAGIHKLFDGQKSVGALIAEITDPKPHRRIAWVDGEFLVVCSGHQDMTAYYCCLSPGHGGRCYSFNKVIDFEPTNREDLYQVYPVVESDKKK